MPELESHLKTVDTGKPEVDSAPLAYKDLIKGLGSNSVRFFYGATITSAAGPGKTSDQEAHNFKRTRELDYLEPCELSDHLFSLDPSSGKQRLVQFNSALVVSTLQIQKDRLLMTEREKLGMAFFDTKGNFVNNVYLKDFKLLDSNAPPTQLRHLALFEGPTGEPESRFTIAIQDINCIAGRRCDPETLEPLALTLGPSVIASLAA